MGDLLMPSLGADMDHGRVLEWLVAPGDTVHRGQVVAVVDTEKAAMDIESFEDGVVQELLVDVDATVPVGTPLAVLGPPARPARVAISPMARRLARELGVDVSGLHGTGRGGVVTAQDVRVAAGAEPTVEAEPTAEAQPTAEAEPTVEAEPTAATERAARAEAARRATAVLMARSKREVPHYYLSSTIDLSRALARLSELNADRGVAGRLVPAAMLLKASALAVRKVPQLNGYWLDDAFAPAEQVNLGVAVALRQGGLIAPAIADADRLDLDTLMAALRDLVSRVRAGRVRQSEMTSGTLTVTNLGDRGVEAVFGVIYPPQVALVGFGRVVERPWATNGTVAVHPTVTATLSADHRASDGHIGGLYLAAVDELLQEPEAL